MDNDIDEWMEKAREFAEKNPRSLPISVYVLRLAIAFKDAYEEGLRDGREQAVDDYRGEIDSYER